MIRQTVALFLDAYRELNAKRLFWFVLLISVLVVAAFAFIGIDDRGLTVFTWHIPSPFNTSVIEAETFYKLMFVNLGIKFWLAWAATILALVSTAPIIPDFIAGGAIELTLSKPIARLRLFLTKYLTGLLFVALQVAVFTCAAFVVIGIRGRAWEPSLFLAVPLVVCFFSYLYCFCALIGLLTRSTIASLLITCLLWFCIFLVHSAESGLLLFKIRQEIKVEAVQQDLQILPEKIEELKAKLAAAEASGEQAPSNGEAPPRPGEPGAVPSGGAEAVEARPPAPPDPASGTDGGADSDRAGKAANNGLANRIASLFRSNDPTEPDRKKLERLERTLEQRQRRIGGDQKTLAELRWWHRLIFGVKTVLPKTSETMDFLELRLIKATEMERFAPDSDDSFEIGRDEDIFIPMREVNLRLDAAKRSRTAGWVVGTSLAFEALLLLAGGWIFARRDF